MEQEKFRMNPALGQGPRRTYFTRRDGPRQTFAHSLQLRGGFYADHNQRFEVVERGGLWAGTTCLECYAMVGGTFLHDGLEFLVDLELNDGEICAALHRQHLCDPLMLKRAQLSWFQGRRLSETEIKVRIEAWMAAPIPPEDEPEADPENDLAEGSELA